MENHQNRFVRTMLAYAAQRELSPEQLCHLSGLNGNDLKTGAGDPLTPAQWRSLWHHAVQLSDDALFGLHLGESMQLPALGVVGQLIQHSRTVGEAVSHGAEFLQLVTGLFRMEAAHAKETFTIRFVVNDPDADPFVLRQMMDVFTVFAIHELDGLVWRKIKPVAVRLPYVVASQPEYNRLLRCDVVGKSAECAMDFEQAYWHEGIITANYELQQLLLQKASALDATLEQGQPMKEKVRGFLLTNAYLGIPSLEEMAANFNTSARSLQRRLQDEGITYQQLADSTRKSLALHYLKSDKHPLKEISYILGYNEISAFSRAFKRWTGASPVSYQKG